MRVYVETNFVLELTLEQEQQPSCDEILRMGEAGAIQVVIPAFCLAEPFGTLRRRQIAQSELKDQLDRVFREIRRTQRYTQETASSAVASMLVHSAQEAADNFNAVIERLLTVAEILPLTSESFTASMELRASYGLTHPDALVLATVLSDAKLGRVPACFLNRNTRDFDDPSIVSLLSARSCKLLGRFDHGLTYIRSTQRSVRVF